MKITNLINLLLGTLSFTAFLTSTNIVQALCDVPCGPPGGCCKDGSTCCDNNSMCCDSTGEKSQTVSIKITPADILAYAQAGSHPDWDVSRGTTANLVPTTVDQIKEVTVKKQEGGLTVNYKIYDKDKGKWTAQSATLTPKKKASSS